MLRTDDSVLYVGKAASLHHRVNSYFRKQNGVPERSLEMLSQARAISFDVTPSPLEAALLEPDEIKRHRPPYNVALTIQDRPELKRLIAAGAPVALRLGVGPALDESRLASALWWV
jgi:excinuclease UvrABC nuclease subunit